MLNSKQYLISKLEEQSNGSFTINGMSFRIKSNPNFSPIQYQKSTNKVLIEVEGSTYNSFQFLILDYQSNPEDITFLDITDTEPTNIFWSQLEDNILVIIYDQSIELYDTIADQTVTYYSIDGLINCKPCGNYSILHRFAGISLIDSSLCILTPIVTDSFILRNNFYNSLKDSLTPNTSKYLSSSFEPIEDTSTTDYRFTSFYGLSIEPIPFLLNLHLNSSKYPKICDFVMRGSNLFIIYDNNCVVRIILRNLPSLFDQSHDINISAGNDMVVIFPREFQLERFIFSDSCVFGVNGKQIYRIFNECCISILPNSRIPDQDYSSLICCIKKKKSLDEIVQNPDEIDQLLLLLSGPSGKRDLKIYTIDDESIYYESKLQQRLANIQKRKNEIANLQKQVENKLTQFELTFKQHPSFKDIIEIHLKHKNDLKKLVDMPLKLHFDFNETKMQIDDLESQVKMYGEKHESIITSNQQNIISLTTTKTTEESNPTIEKLRELYKTYCGKLRELHTMAFTKDTLTDDFSNLKKECKKHKDELYTKLKQLFDPNTEGHISCNTFVYTIDNQIFHSNLRCDEMRIITPRSISLLDAITRDWDECSRCRPIAAFIKEADLRMRSASSNTPSSAASAQSSLLSSSFIFSNRFLGRK